MSVVIEIRCAGRPAQVREYPQGRITIGRGTGHIALSDPQASARHAELNVTPRGVTFVDLKSTNGSFLESGERLTQPFQWAPGSVIRIGSSSLRLVSFAAPDFGPSGTLMVPVEAQSERTAGSPRDGMSLAPHTPAIARLLRGEGTPALVSVPTPPLVPTPPPVPALPTPLPVPAPPAAVPVPPDGGPPAALAAAPSALQPAAVSVGVAVPPPSAAAASDADEPAEGNAERISYGPQSESDNTFVFLTRCLRAYRSYAIEGWKVVGWFALPLGVLSGTEGRFGLLDVLVPPLTSIGYAVVFFLFGLGAQAEFAMRAYAGLPVSSVQVRRIQSRRMIPWLVELLPPILLTLLGCAFSLLAFAPMLVPVYMVERITGLSVNTRSVDLLTRGWAKSLLPLLLVAGVLGAVLVAGTVSLHSIPVVGVWAAALFGPMWLALTLPFILFLQFHAYADTRWRVEGVDVAELIRSEA